MKSDWEPFYVAVVFSEVERFLNDLAGASLSVEYEKRREALERKISTVRKISPPPLLKHNTPETPEQNQPRRHRSWSCPPTISHEPLQETLEKKRGSSPGNSTSNEGEAGLPLISMTSLQEGEDSLKPEATRVCLFNGKRFERLRQAYNNTIKFPRQRSASVPHVLTVREEHRKPNPEYIQGISCLTVYEKRKDSERKPNRKGFNVMWRCGEDEG